MRGVGFCHVEMARESRQSEVVYNYAERGEVEVEFLDIDVMP